MRIKRKQYRKPHNINYLKATEIYFPLLRIYQKTPKAQPVESSVKPLKCKEMIYNDNTPIAALTVADLKALIAGLNEEKPKQPETKTARYVYGLQGIRDIFGCSHATAQRYKNTFLRDAIIQNGRKIVIDVDKAMTLFAQRKTL